MNTNDPRVSETRIHALTIAMQKALRKVGPTIVERAGKVEFVHKHDGSPVTDTDIEVEKTIQAEYGRSCPDIPVYGEEGGYTDDLNGTFWLIDPIDGTKSFINNMPTFTSMAALIENGETVASIIYNPSTDDMYTAQKGMGAYKNGAKIDIASLPMAPVAISKPLFFKSLNETLSAVGIQCETTLAGGFDFTRVLDATVAARFNLHSKGYTHDYAPGALLVSEAGGVIIPVLDETYTYKTRSFVACHPSLAKILRQNIIKLRQLETMEESGY